MVIFGIIGVGWVRAQSGMDEPARIMSPPGAPLVELIWGLPDWQCFYLQELGKHGQSK